MMYKDKKTSLDSVSIKMIVYMTSLIDILFYLVTKYFNILYQKMNFIFMLHESLKYSFNYYLELKCRNKIKKKSYRINLEGP